MALLTARPTVGGSNNTWGTTLNTIVDETEDNLERCFISIPIRSPIDGTYPICINPRFAMLIKQASYKTDVGTCTVAVQINGTNITGLSALAVTSTEATTVATAANVVAIGDTVQLVLTSVSGVGYLNVDIWYDRTSAGTA
jgi:hypothetical protein